MAEVYSIDDVDNIIECEGLDYAIQHYISASAIEDETLADMWNRANILLNDISCYVEENRCHDFDEDE